ncbi:MAG: MATE family efflux transporter [Christensenellales bacterium]|jgi:putative MATE family efflux protein
MAKTQKLSLAGIAVPLLFENILRSLMGTVNVLMLSRVSDGAVASIGIVNQYLNVAMVVFSVFSNSSTVALTQALGAEKRREAERLATVIVSVLLFIGFVFSLLLGLFPNFMLSFMRIDATLLPDTISYMRIVGGTLFLQATGYALGAVLRSFGYARLSLGLALTTNVINIALNYLVIFRPGVLPLSGVTGVAAALAISQLLGVVLSLFAFQIKNIRLRLRELFPLPWRSLKAALSIGLPASVAGLTYNVVQLIVTSFIASLGTEAVAVKVYVNQIATFVYAIGFACGQASQIITGHMLGAGRVEDAKRLHRKSLLIGLSCNLSLSFLAWLLSEPLLGLFTQDATALTLGKTVLFVDILVEAGRCLNEANGGTLMGAGDAKIPMVFNSITMLLTTGTSWLFGITLKWGLPGIWFAFALDELIRGILSYIRYKRGEWIFIAAQRIKRLDEQKNTTE